ncbi:MAG: hypothetical protein V4679_22655 [Pseudomonadota bacterium]
MKIGRPLAAILLALGCGHGWAADAVADFKALVEGCKASLAARPATAVQFNEDLKSWVKTARLPAEIRVDVQPTDSPTRPFSAVIDITDVVANAKAPGEQAARQLNVTAGDGLWTSSRFVQTLNFAYEEGRWVPVDGTRTHAFRMKGAPQFDKPSSMRLSAANMQDPQAPYAACIPK